MKIPDGCSCMLFYYSIIIVYLELIQYISVLVYPFGICSKSTMETKTTIKLTIKTPERSHWRRSIVFIANFEQISHILMFLLLTVNK